VTSCAEITPKDRRKTTTEATVECRPTVQFAALVPALNLCAGFCAMLFVKQIEKLVNPINMRIGPNLNEGIQ